MPEHAGAVDDMHESRDEEIRQSLLQKDPFDKHVWDRLDLETVRGGERAELARCSDMGVGGWGGGEEEVEGKVAWEDPDGKVVKVRGWDAIKGFLRHTKYCVALWYRSSDLNICWTSCSPGRPLLRS